MDHDLAKHVAIIGFRSMSHLTDLLPLLRTHCDATEADLYVQEIANVAGVISVELIGKVFASYPSVERELDSKIRKYGKFL